MRPGFAAAFAVATAILAGSDSLSITGAVVLIVLWFAGDMTDVLDGIAARHFGTVSQLGGIFDPMVDSLSRLTVYFSLALVGWVTIAVPLVMVGRDIIVAYTRIVQAITGGKTSARISGKAKAVVQGVCVPVLIGIVCFQESMSTEWIVGVRYGCAAILIIATCWSLVDYFLGALPGIREMAQK